MSTETSSLKKRFEEAFGPGNPFVPRPLPGKAGVTVVLRGKRIYLTKAKTPATIPSPGEDEGQE